MCTISLAPGGAFYLTIPSPADGREQILTIPASVEGLRVIRRVLTARADQPVQSLGSDGEPVQSLVDAWLRADAEAKASRFDHIAHKLVFDL